jgi:tetratricopeptide (TPR) repeat protein
VATDADASVRSATGEGLRRRLRGDLDTIVARALKKNPAERYASVDALASDVRRHLENEPISARHDSVGYRTAKFVRRHRAGVIVGLLVAAAAVGGTLAILAKSREARLQRDEARGQLARATAANDFLGFLLSAAAPPGRQFVVADLLEQGEALADKEYANDDVTHADLLFGIGRQYIGTERWERAVPVLERAVKTAFRSQDPAIIARTQCSLAIAYLATGRGTGVAEKLMTEALDTLPDETRYASARADCLIRRSEFGYFTDQGPAMLRDATEALAVLDRAQIPSRVARLDAQASLAYGFYLDRQNAKADRAYAELAKQLEASGRERTLAAADVYNNWSLVHFLGDLRRSEALQHRSLELHRAIEGAGSVNTGALLNYAGILVQLARYDAAKPLYDETLRTARTRNDLRLQLDATISLAVLQARMGRPDDASKTLRDLEPHREHRFFQSKLRRAFIAYAEGQIAAARGAVDEARRSLAESVDLYDQVEAKYLHSFLALVGLSQAELATGHPEAAEAAARRALALAETMAGVDSPSYLIGIARAALGEVQLARGTPDAAASFATALEQLEPTLGLEHPTTLRIRSLTAPPPA